MQWRSAPSSLCSAPCPFSSLSPLSPVSCADLFKQLHFNSHSEARTQQLLLQCMMVSSSDAPKVPSVVLSSFGEILENSSVTLTCSSDANPEANYSWYKKNGDPDFQALSPEAELLFSSIQSTDSGEYYCEAENQLGKRRSKLFMLDVKCELKSFFWTQTQTVPECAQMRELGPVRSVCSIKSLFSVNTSSAVPSWRSCDIKQLSKQCV